MCLYFLGVQLKYSDCKTWQDSQILPVQDCIKIYVIPINPAPCLVKNYSKHHQPKSEYNFFHKAQMNLSSTLPFLLNILLQSCGWHETHNAEVQLTKRY